jgi:hypothetical protein
VTRGDAPRFGVRRRGRRVVGVGVRPRGGDKGSGSMYVGQTSSLDELLDALMREPKKLACVPE